jgi:hypothetical protein
MQAPLLKITIKRASLEKESRDIHHEAGEDQGNVGKDQVE